MVIIQKATLLSDEEKAFYVVSFLAFSSLWKEKKTFLYFFRWESKMYKKHPRRRWRKSLLSKSFTFYIVVKMSAKVAVKTGHYHHPSSGCSLSLSQRTQNTTLFSTRTIVYLHNLIFYYGLLSTGGEFLIERKGNNFSSKKPLPDSPLMSKILSRISFLHQVLSFEV